MKTFTDLDDMMKELNGLTIEEAEALGISEAEEHGEWAMIYCSWSKQKKLDKILKKHNLNLITLSIFDAEVKNETEDEDSEESPPSSYTYTTGWNLVNREMWLFYKGPEIDAMCEEIVD